MNHVTIFRDERIYASHASVCLAANGDLLVAFRQGPLRQVFAHVDPEASVGLVRSRDMGRTWDQAGATTVLDPGEEINLNDPSITALRDGTLILTVFASHAPWAANAAKFGEAAMAVRGTDYYYVQGKSWILLSRSFDNGLTWEGPITVDASAYGTCGASVFASIAELSDGTLVMPITASSGPEKQVAALIASRDRGASWEPYSIITRWNRESASGGFFGLPSVAAYDDKHMLAAGWSLADPGTLLTSSEDGGLTWSPTRPVVTHGACMHLCVTKSGATLLSYGYRNPPYGIRVWPSFDRGLTWDPARAAALRSDGAMRDLGYPRTIQLPDGRLFTVYYYNVDDADRSYYDEEASMAICKHWKLDPALYTYQTAGLRFIGGTIYTEEELASLGGTATLEPKDSPQVTLL